MHKTLGLALVAVLGLASLVRAEPVNLQQISADAKWAVHLDIDALRATSVAKKAADKVVEKHPEIQGHLAMVQSVVRFNPCTDLHSVTIYGRQIRPNAGVAIVRANVDKALLLDKAKLAPEYRMSSYGKYELHSWVHAKGSKHERTMTGAFYKDDVLLFALSADEVMAAIDVLDGKKPNFAGKETGLLTNSTLPSGAILVAGAIGLDGVDLPCKSPLVKQLNSLVLVAGEDQDNLFVQGHLVVKDAEVAKQLKSVADGAIAMALLAKSDDADAVKLINAVKVTVADKAVVVEGRASIDAVWAHVQKAVAEAEKAHKNWRHHGKPEGCPLGK